MNGTTKITSSQRHAGMMFGYIIVPPDVDRTKFVEQCYRWERVSVLVERGAGAVHECYITRHALGEVVFPETSSKLGSCVACVMDVFSNHLTVIGVLSKEDESQLLREGLFKLSKTFNGGTVTITGDAPRGVITIAVDGGDVSEINIVATNTTKDAGVNVRCQGDINLQPDGVFRVNSGSEPMVKGAELKTQLDNTNTYLSDLYSAIYTALVALDAVVPGVSAAFQASMAGKSPGDYTDINSEESWLD